MARKDANPGKREAAVERHIQAFELRKAGASFREVAATLGVSVATAHEDVQRVLAELTAQRAASAAEYVQMELERLDAAQFALFQHLDTGDPQIINAWVKVSESRRKLLGLDAQPGGLMPGDTVIVVRWHDANRQIIDVTPIGDHTSAAPQIAADDGTTPGAVSYRVRWSEMGQEPACSDAEPENGA
jgi:hypothetical protein